MMTPPEVLDSTTPLETHIRQDIYRYTGEDAEEEPNTVEFYVNFSDEDLFHDYGDKVLNQDELMVLEHPVLGSLREVLLVHQTDARLLNTSKIMTESKREIEHTTLSPVCDTPCVILNAQRHVEVSLYPDSKKGIPKGLFGNEFDIASRSQVLTNCRKLPEPTASNVICMVAGSMGIGFYTLAQCEKLLATCYTAFKAAKAAAVLMCENEDTEEPTHVVIHTGNWGCGSSRGSAELMCIIQTLAARLAGINHLVYHGVTASQTKLVTNGYKKLYGLTEGTSTYRVRTLLKTLLANGRYKWGRSTVVRKPLLHGKGFKNLPKKEKSPKVPKQKPPPGAPAHPVLSKNGNYFFRPASWPCMWSISKFTVNSITYCCAGQYIMSIKARLFKLDKLRQDILAEKKAPIKIQKLAAKIKGTSAEEKLWDEQIKRVAQEALVAKFAQNLGLRNKLMSTGEDKFVYSSMSDEVWGNGLDFPYQDDKRALDSKQWLGGNLLGKSLDIVKTWAMTLGSPDGGCLVKPLEDHYITVEDIIQFCFPNGVLFPDSTDRLFMIAEYGPLFRLQNRFTGLCKDSINMMEAQRHKDKFAMKIFRGEAFTYAEIKDCKWITDEDKHAAKKNVCLKGGPANEAILTNTDIKALAAAMVRYDIMRVYECPKTMGLEEQEEYIKAIPAHKRRRDNMTKPEVAELFTKVLKDSQNRMEFRAFCEIVQAIRAKWVKDMKMMFPAVDPKPKPVLTGYKSSNLATRMLGKKMPDTLTWMLTDRLIHKSMSNISALEDHGKGAAFRQNVLLLRNDALTNKETNWDPYCCLKGINKGTYVNKPRASKDIGKH